jgi:hypothetical protein
MGRAFTSIGIVTLVGTLGWWHSFYGQVHRLLGATGPLPIDCLYSMSSACRLVANAAEIFGARSYHPLIFWAACGCLLIGLGLGAGGRVPKRRSRNGVKPRSRSMIADDSPLLGTMWCSSQSSVAIRLGYQCGNFAPICDRRRRVVAVFPGIPIPPGRGAGRSPQRGRRG